MQQVRIHGPDDVRIDRVDVPTPGPRDVVLAVKACGICGSDVGYIAAGGLVGPMPEPMPIGHELAGVVEAVGAEVEGVAEGDAVILNPLGADNQIGNGGPEGGFADRLLVRNAAAGESLYKVPEGVPLDRAALAEPLGVGCQAVKRSGAVPGSKVVIFGAGPIGLAATATCAARGIDDVIVVDLSPERLAIAEKLGARASLDASEGQVWEQIRELHGAKPLYGMPFAASDCLIEATGAGPVLQDLVNNAGPDACISVVGLHKQEVPINFTLVLMKELSLLGSMAYPEDYSEAVELVTRPEVEAMITHRFPLESFDAALAQARDPKSGAKVIVEVG